MGMLTSFFLLKERGIHPYKAWDDMTVGITTYTTTINHLSVTTKAEGVVLFPGGSSGSVIVTVTFAQATVLSRC